MPPLLPSTEMTGVCQVEKNCFSINSDKDWTSITEPQLYHILHTKCTQQLVTNAKTKTI